MRCDKAVILDGGMVTDMIATPQGNVIADSDEWLDGIVFEYEAVITDTSVVQQACSRADVTGACIAE